MKKELTLLSALFALFSISAQNPTTTIATWKNDANGAYSFIHDDYGDFGVRGINDYADTIARNRGIKFTFGAITKACEDSPEMWTDAISMINYGHEIINHSHNHYCAVGNSWCTTGLWAEPSTEDFATEMTYSTNSINTNTGVYPRYFIYPYDLFNAAANNHLKTLNYIGSRTGTYEGSDPANFTPDADGFFRSALIVDTQDNNGDITAVNLNYWADYAASNSVWINREMHNVGNSGWGRIGVTDYRNHLNHLKSKMDANELWIGTVSEVLTYQIQKINYTPTTIYSVAENKITITWNTPSFDVANYLAPLNTKSPVTIKVDLDGINTSSMIVMQNGIQIVDVIEQNGILQFDAFPHQGTITISPSACTDFCLVTGLTDQVASVGNNSSFNINITSSGGVTYAWYFNNVLIPNEQNSSLNLLNVQNSDAGTYKVIASKGGQTIESTATLSVNNQQAFNNTIAAIPGTIEFENFDTGGQDVAYNESSGTNQGGSAYRSEPVDIEDITGGGYSIGYVQQNEWLEYTVNVATSGTYNVKIKHASLNTDADVLLSMDGITVSNSLTLAATGGWTTWATTDFTNISLTAGQHVLRVLMQDDDVNLDHVIFELDQATAVVTTVEGEHINIFPNPFLTNFTIQSEKGNVQSVSIKTLNGQTINSFQNTELRNTFSLGENLTAGVYLIELTINDTLYREILIKK